MGMAALKLAGVINKSGHGRKIFCAHFARGLLSTLLDKILDMPLTTTVMLRRLGSRLSYAP